MENKIIKIIVGGTILFGFTLMMLFTILNFMLGCESWDQSYWTEYNSCIYPSEFLGMFLPPYGG
jgi:hypothetical protein